MSIRLRRAQRQRGGGGVCFAIGHREEEREVATAQQQEGRVHEVPSGEAWPGGERHAEREGEAARGVRVGAPKLECVSISWPSRPREKPELSLLHEKGGRADSEEEQSATSSPFSVCSPSSRPTWTQWPSRPPHTHAPRDPRRHSLAIGQAIVGAHLLDGPGCGRGEGGVPSTAGGGIHQDASRGPRRREQRVRHVVSTCPPRFRMPNEIYFVLVCFLFLIK